MFQLPPSAVSWAPPRTAGATAATFSIWALRAPASPSDSETPVPAPWLTKPPPAPREAPGLMINMLEPRPPMALVTICWAPRPMEVIITTAATPMTTPSEVRALRIGWATMAPVAKRTRSMGFIVSRPRRR